MKIIEIFAATEYREHPPEATKDTLDFLQGAEVLTQLEGDRFSLLKRDDYYALRRNSDNQIMCWVELSPTVKNMEGLDVKMIYILPEFRNGVAASVLLFSVKHYLNKPLIVDGAVSKQGQSLLNAVMKRPRHFKVWYVNRDTESKQPYTTGMLQPYDSDHIIVVEQHSKKCVLITEHTLPGGYVHKYTESFFEADHKSLENC